MQGVNRLSIKTNLIIQRSLSKITYWIRIREREEHDEGRISTKNHVINAKIMVWKDQNYWENERRRSHLVIGGSRQ